ncbi:protein transport protein Sec23A-like isoform X2 [Artemia franciscana]|uniref:protein transport protein Sec23A-like isoform X2 n=1 Tax=Artemia franciscana TaxID=6661 RepID=UPI0032DA7AF2
MMSQDVNSFFADSESKDGVRMSFNCWPASRIEAAKLVLPLGVMYTPFKKRESEFVLPYEPVVCRTNNCKAILNSLCNVDYRAKLWSCVICNQRNAFPASYAHASETQMPGELYQESSTVEYSVSSGIKNIPPVFLYVVDTCIEPDELNALKRTLLESLHSLPPNSLCGLITFGKYVYVHEINPLVEKAYAFKGTKEYSSQDLLKLLKLDRQTAAPAPRPAYGVHGPSVPTNKFLKPLSETLSLMEEIFEGIQRDTFEVQTGRRYIRSVGAALSIAVNLLETTHTNVGGRIMSFIGGACTDGLGMIVDDDLRNTIRTHHVIEQGQAKYLKKATKFYEALAMKASKNGHAVDIYTAALDQIGLLEMKSLPSLTGGNLVLADSFESSLFSESLKKVFARDEEGNCPMAFNAVMDVRVSKELRISGCIGPCVSMGVKHPSVADMEIGVGGTTQWKFCSLLPTTTPAIFFDIVPQAPTSAGGQGYIQFVTNYQHINGERRIRVTTIARSYLTSSDDPVIRDWFDQDAAAVLLARLSVFRLEREDAPDVMRWLDRNLIKICQKFSSFTTNQPESYLLPQSLEFFPQAVYHLRRSPFLQFFNNSPDETTFYRSILLREDTESGITMIQPYLLEYSSLTGKESTPVSLDATSLKKDTILLMDTFFHVLVYHGADVVYWKNQGFDQLPEYAHLKVFMEAPLEDATEIVSNRFPVPRYVVTEEGASQARFLLSKVNPSITHTQPNYQGEGGAILTDDVSLEVFLQHLRKLVVSSQN